MFERGGPTFFELIRQGLSSTDEGYDLLAPKFEHTPFRTPDVVLDAVARACGPAGQLLDLCCGTGAGLRAFRASADSLSGVDRSAGMLAQARLNVASARLTQGDALALPFARRFDTVVSFGAFGHILEADEPRLVAEVHRVLRPGGRFVFVTAQLPGALDPSRLLAEGFNWVMRVRNQLLKPQFIMYYLTFLLPKAQLLLEAQGFSVEVLDGVFEKRFARLKLVIATTGRGS
jgi:ubiquinone/menaquinone biosynthesis C-methylase UbiE